MSIFHRSILAGAAIVPEDEDDPMLKNILLEPDGTIIAMNRWALYAASPVNVNIIKALPLTDTSLIAPAIVSTNQIENLVKTIPTDKSFKGMLEYTSIKNSEGNILECFIHDGRGVRNITLRASQTNNLLLQWRDRFKNLSMKKSGLTNFVYNRARLRTVIKAVEMSCKYNGEFAFIDQKPFENGYIWKTFNELTGQTVLIVWILSTLEKNLPTSFWERTLFPINSLRRP